MTVYTCLTPDDGYPSHWGKPPPGGSAPAMIRARRDWIDFHEALDEAEQRERRPRRVDPREAAATLMERRYDPYIDDD